MNKSKQKLTRISHLRKEYTLAGLTEKNLDRDPLKQFEKWFEEAVSANLPEPTAMTLATATKKGVPSARIVLLKNADDRGFVFFTNFESRKGIELAANPLAALVFHWTELERQVRISGSVTKVSPEESSFYFRSRPHGSQLGAWASHQSKVISGRGILEKRIRDLTAQYGQMEIPVPSFWGGFRLVPSEIEFWQGRPNRLHDRLRVHPRAGKKWKIERLAP